MAILANTETNYGEPRKLYIRLNNFEQLCNHGVPIIVVFRGYISREAYEAGKGFVWERTIQFEGNAPDYPWPLAYEHLKLEADLADIEDVNE